jgi:hypothetical protein
MRKAATVVFLLALLIVAYVVSPLWVAVDVRRATFAGDTTTLEARVDFARVRQSLKESLAVIERDKQEEAARRGLPRPSLWARVKAAASPVRYTDQIIDRYVTADGLVRIAAARGSLANLIGARQTASADEFTIPDHAQPFVERAQRLRNRLKRVTLKSLTSVEIEVADRRVPSRSYVGVISFVDLRWRLTDLRVVGAGF